LGKVAKIELRVNLDGFDTGFAGKSRGQSPKNMDE
jgi:hypothetical protein